jgi:hypothetical protein
VKGCHASGKTWCAAGLPLWWLARYKTGKTFTTAPTLRQVKTFWKDVAVAYLGSRLRTVLPEPTSQGLQVAPDRYAFGASSSAGVNVQGLHGSEVLIIADEAPGIEQDIWDAIEGIRAGGRVRVLEMGNPVVPSGHFYDSFTVARSSYECISISAFDTPNFQKLDGTTITEAELLAMSKDELADNSFPSLITKSWVYEMLHVWGPQHPKYKARVLGEFPSDDPYSCFPLAWLEKAKRTPTLEELSNAKKYRIMVGIDVAGAGSDETVLTARVAGIIIGQWAWPDADPRGAVCRVLGELRARRDYVFGSAIVDTVGIGYNFALHLADQGFPVVGFNAGARPIQSDRFANLKAEAYWTFREYLRQNEISNLTDEQCNAQLSTIRYRENPRGLTEIESKDERNKRGIPGSPDRAESAIMAFLRVVPATQQQVYDGSYQISPI